MTDLHSHIIFNVDDGSKDIDESIKLLKELKGAGFDNVIMTPHYIVNSEYSAKNKEKLQKLNILREKVKEENIDINLYLGNEIYINDKIPNLIKKGEIYTLNNSKYLLFEIPFHNQILGLNDYVYELKVAGYTPILAHPERYTYFQKNRKLVDKLKEEGLLFQANYSSIIGTYGKASKKLLKYMLKKGYIDYFGTDIHHLNKTFVADEFDKIEKKLIKYAGEEYYRKIIKNGDDILKEETN